jgi:hypothetical protein
MMTRRRLLGGLAGAGVARALGAPPVEVQEVARCESSSNPTLERTRFARRSP